MKKIFLALTILSAAASGFFAVRQSTTRLQEEARASCEAWLVQTQLVAVAQNDQAGLNERVRELKQALTQPQPVENALWSVLQTNRAGQLTPDVREHLLEELGFNWKSSEEFIVVSKQALRDIGIKAILPNGKLTEDAGTVLVLTPAEREQVEAATERVKSEFRDWALAHTERSEPKGDVVAQYTLPANLAMNGSNNFASALFEVVGKQRAELMMNSSPDWMNHPGIRDKTVTLIVKRYMVGNEERLKVRDYWGGNLENNLENLIFPEAFRPVFPNGWPDLAKREVFELPNRYPH